MRGVGFGFYALGVLFVIAGMVWGIFMAATGDHAMLSAHAHLNLVGWVTFGLVGTYYTLTPHAAFGRLARIHLGLATVGVVLMVPGIAWVTAGGPEGVAIAGSMVTFAAMLIFAGTVLRHGFGARS